MIKQNEVYVCVDVETDGPKPGYNNMLSIGAAAYTLEGEPGHRKKKLIDTFTINLQNVSDCVSDEYTMKEFWKKNPKAWNTVIKNQQLPGEAIQKFVNWVNNLSGVPVFAAYPAAFDFCWINHYIMEYCDKSPFRYHTLDIRTLAMGIRILQNKEPSFFGWARNDLPRSWFDGLPHTHIALDDAVEQGALLCNILLSYEARAWDR